MDDPPHFPLAPISASILAEREAERRNSLRKGYIRTRCAEIDDYMLRGGLERGQVVGLSAEDEDFGVVVSHSHLACVSANLLGYSRWDCRFSPTQCVQIKGP
jgi:hypothetical protein